MFAWSAAGKKTPAVRFGRLFARVEITFCLVGGIVVVPGALWLTWHRHPGAFLGMLAILPAVGVLKAVWRHDDAKHLNPALARTAKSLLLFGTAFSLGVWLW